MSTSIQPDLDEDFWEDLLTGIEERRVIPIVGPELLAYDQGPPFGQAVAVALASRLRLPATELPAAFGLQEVVEAHLRLRGRREDLYAKVKAVVRELALPPPPALLALAAIDGFDLFVSLTYDAMLVDALDAVRHAGVPRTLHLGFSPNRAQDLPSERQALTVPVVYGLLGRLSSMPEYALSDEDRLEFLHALQSESRRPPLLFDELQNNHLLLLGCSLPDWLARFFIRTAKSRQLSVQRAEVETIIERRIAGEASLTMFLERFSYGTRVRAGDPVSFVAELALRWKRRQPQEACRAGTQAEPAAAVEPGAVFISYASEDAAAARALSDALRAQGVDVWFDKSRLEAGDLYDQLIRRRIKACSLFVPLVSSTTQRRLEGYFRREWRLAEERVEGIAEELPFILPVALDDSGPASPGVPQAFARAHWSRLPGGVADEAFTRRVVTLVRGFRKRQLGLA